MDFATACDLALDHALDLEGMDETTTITADHGFEDDEHFVVFVGHGLWITYHDFRYADPDAPVYFVDKSTGEVSFALAGNRELADYLASMRRIEV